MSRQVCRYGSGVVIARRVLGWRGNQGLVVFQDLNLEPLLYCGEVSFVEVSFSAQQVRVEDFADHVPRQRVRATPVVVCWRVANMIAV